MVTVQVTRACHSRFSHGILECYTISRVDKNPKFGITRGKETQKEGKKNDDLQQRIQRRSDPAVR